MSDGVDHILNVLGIMKNFSIQKKFSKKEIDAIKNKVLEKNGDPSEQSKEFQKQIMNYTNSYLEKHKIPGIIQEEIESSPKDSVKIIKNQKLVQLYQEAYFDALKLKNKKISKKLYVFFILSLIGQLEITQEEFEKYSKQLMEEMKSDDIDTGNGDEYSDGYPE